MSDYADHFWGMATSYGIALLGIVSTDNLMFLLGAVLLVVRLLYEAIRLYRYIKNPNGDANE